MNEVFIKESKKNAKGHKAIIYPFAPKIPWGFKRNGVLNPKINIEILNSIINESKEIRLLSFAGPMESFFSRIYSGAFKGYEKDIYFCGNFEEMNNLKKGVFSNNLLDKYPAPIFLDKSGIVYINYLYQYLNWRGVSSIKIEKRKEYLWEQLVFNLPFEYNFECIRSKNKGKILIIDGGDSYFNIDFLKWSLNQIKEFISIMTMRNFKVEIYTKRKYYFYGTRAIVKDISNKDILESLKSSEIVISREIDWLMIGLYYGVAVFGISYGIYDLIKNSEKMNSYSFVYTKEKKLQVMEVCDICCSL